jgi:Cof subfamily protein (haloacid dehalogenase superfamily)
VENRKMLILDLDGTAITNEYLLTNELLSLCNELRETMDICIATGRSVSDGFRYYKKLELQDFMICYNGAYIWNPISNEIDYCKYMDDAFYILHFIFENYEAVGIENIIVSSGINTYILNDENSFLCDMMYDEDLPYIYTKRGIMKNLNDVHRIIFSCKSNITEVQNRIKKVSMNINVNGWRGREDIIDISIGKVDKWNAVKRVVSQKEISLENVIAFGDGKNDIPLLRGAGIGIAMLNSCNEVKKCADFVTQFDNDNNGVYNFVMENRKLF